MAGAFNTAFLSAACPGSSVRPVYRKLLELMDREEEGSIRIYCLCTSCDQRTHVIGCDLLDPRVSPEEEDLFIV